MINLLKKKNPMKTCKMRLILIALISSLIPLGLSAQEAQDESEDSDEEIVELSAFEVSEDAVRGYATTSSLVGSRVAVAIVDMPSSVITINENLINDTVALDLRDTLNHISGVTHANAGTGNQEQNQFSMRGYVQSTAQRDGLPDRSFTASGGFDYSLVERIEIVKGPTGVLYGNHSPGGVLNLVSKFPRREARTRSEITFGSFDTWRVSIDHSAHIDKEDRLGYRFSGAWADTDGPLRMKVGEPGFGRGIYNPSISYRFDNGLKVWGWAAIIRDSMKRRQRMVVSFPNFDGGGQGYRGTGVAFLPMLKVGKYSNVTQTDNNVETDSYEVGLSHSFDIGKMEAAIRLTGRYADQFSDGSRVRPSGARLYLDESGGLIGRDARNIDFGDVDGRLTRLGRATLSFDDRPATSKLKNYNFDFSLKFRTGRIGHNLLTYVQYSDTANTNEDDRWEVTIANMPQDLLTSAGFTLHTFTEENGVPLSSPITLGSIELWPSPTFQGISGDYVLNLFDLDIADGDVDGDGNEREYTRRNTRTPRALDAENISWGVLDRVSLFENRVILVGAARFDDFKSVSQVFSGELGGLTSTSEDADSQWTFKFGFVGKAYSGDKGTVSIFYNNAETFIPEFRQSTLLSNFGEKFPNRTASTDEIGVKVDLMSNRIVMTASYFDNKETDVLVSVLDESGLTDLECSVTNVCFYLAPVAERTTDGFEIDIGWNPKPGLNFIFSYGTVDASEPVNETTSRIPAQIPESTFSALARYQFQEGYLQGLSFTYEFGHLGESQMNQFTGFVVPSSSIHHAIIGLKRGKWDARLRIENIFDEFEQIPGQWWTATAYYRERNFRLSIAHTF